MNLAHNLQRFFRRKLSLGVQITLAFVLTVPYFLMATPAYAAAPEYADPPQPPGAISGTGPLWISSEGRYVGFAGVFDYAGDGLGGGQFMRDRQAQTITRLSSLNPNTGTITGVTADLRYAVLYTSVALVPQDTNHQHDVYVLDRNTNSYELISQSTAGIPGNAESFTAAFDIVITPDGRYVTFTSSATNLAGGVTPPNKANVYVRDRLLQTTTRLSTNASGNAGNDSSFESIISRDGSSVVYLTNATDLVGGPGDRQVVEQDIASGAKVRVSTPVGLPDTGAGCSNAAISSDGRYIALACVGLLTNSNSVRDVYRYDRSTNSLTLLVTFNDVESVHMSGDGNRVIITTSTHVGYYLDAGSSIPIQYGIDNQWPVISENGLVLAAQEIFPTSNPSRTGIWTLPPLTNPDTAPPTLGMPVWSNNPKPTNGTSTLTVPATDNLSGIQSAEFYVGDTDPGQGNGSAMTLANPQTNGQGAVISADLTAGFDTSLQPGIYKISIRARDVAGNWSAIISDYLVVFDPTGPTNVAGSKQEVPQMANGDTLPGLLSTTQNDKAKLAFDVSYTTSGTVSPTSKLSLDYATGQSCNSPHPANCHTTNFTVNTVLPNVFDWLTVTGTNGSVGTFQGQGTLTLDGAVTTNPFKVQATDGDRLTPSIGDDAVLYIYAPGANPAMASALYQLHFHVNGNWVKIQ